MRSTSIVVWKAIQFELPRSRAEAFRAVCATPHRTGRELEADHGLRHINKRLVELARLGLIRVSTQYPEAKCSVTGHAALAWEPVDLTAPPETELPRREGWKARALRAEAELAALRGAA